MLFTQLFEDDFNKKKLNEVNPHDFDSDEDYYAAVRGKRKPAYDDDFDMPDDEPDYSDDESYYEKSLRSRGLGEGAGDIGSRIKAAYQRIYNQGDDAVEFAYYDSPIFAQYWDEYEGDLDSIIAEVDPQELQIILDELESAAEDQGVAEAGEWTRTPSGDYINMHTGVRSSSMPKKSKPRAGNRMSDMTVGSPKIVHKNGRAVGEIGLDHDPSPGQGPYYMKHYETNTWYSGYATKKEALADLKHVVDQMNEGADERKQNTLWAQITAHEKAAKKSKDLKQQHHLKMADQLRSQLKTSDNEQGIAEADKKKEEPEVKDVGLQRAISRAKADFPTAGTGIEALAKDFIRSQDQDQKSFDQIRQAERQQDQMLAQISKIDQEQEQEIQGLEQQNSTLASRLQQLQSVNSELEKKLATMAGRKAEKKSKTDSAPVVGPAATTEPITPVAKKATKPKAKAQPKAQPAKPSNRLVTKQLTAPAPGARAFSSMTPALAAAGNPQQSLFPSDYAQDTANWALQKFKKNAQDIPFRDIQKVNPELRNLAQQELEPTTENNKQKPERPEADYGPDYQDMVSRVKKLAGQGPRKTVWDPVKRVYKTVPVNPPSK